MKKTIVIILIFVGVLLIVFGLMRGNNTSIQNNIPSQGDRTAVDFSLPDYEGKVVSRTDVSDEKILVLNFWASWCPFCVNEMPDFAKLQEEFVDSIAVVAVNRAESIETAKEFSDRVGVTDKLILLLDSNDSLYRSYGAFAMPTTYFIKDNRVVDQKFGPMEIDEMRERVQKLLTASAQ